MCQFRGLIQANLHVAVQLTLTFFVFLFCFFYFCQVVKILNATDEHVMALGANFSLQADSHLVCMQNEQGYKTQAINIQNQARKGTCTLPLVHNYIYTNLNASY